MCPETALKHDFKTYLLSDPDFLEKYARLKYQINKDDLFNYTFPDAESEHLLEQLEALEPGFTEHAHIMSKIWEYLIDREVELVASEEEQTIKDTLLMQYLTEQILMTKQYDHFRTTRQFKRSFLNNFQRSIAGKPKKSGVLSWLGLGGTSPKQTTFDNGYDMFYVQVIQGQFYP